MAPEVVYKVPYICVTVTNNQQLRVRTSPDGTNFDTGNADYAYRLNRGTAAANSTGGDNFAKFVTSTSSGRTLVKKLK